MRIVLGGFWFVFGRIVGLTGVFLALESFIVFPDRLIDYLKDFFGDAFELLLVYTIISMAMTVVVNPTNRNHTLRTTVLDTTVDKWLDTARHEGYPNCIDQPAVLQIDTISCLLNIGIGR